MRQIYLTLIATLSLSPSVAAADETTCPERLERALKAMEARSPMKDEVATSLMWHRMDALEAFASGDLEACSEKLDIVENILNIPANT